MSDSPVPGTVLFAGLLEGPTADWSPDPAAVADALRLRGLPADLMTVGVEGGRGVLQPLEHAYPRSSFAADPAEALALALQDLLQEHPRAATAWFSSLRVIGHGERSRDESLLQLTAEGIHLVRREQPWAPPPPPSLRSRLRANGMAIAFALIGALAIAWLKRDQLRAGWDYWIGGLFGSD